MWEAILVWVTENAAALGGGAALIAIVEKIFAPFRSFTRLFRKPEKFSLDEKSIQVNTKAQPGDTAKLTVPEFIRIRREMKDDLLRELAEAPDDEKDQLRACIAELESQIANPDAELVIAQKRIADLEALLERSGNEIGGDRIAEARAALEHGDYSIADDLFAEIEERRRLEVEEAARAAFGRGEIAEAEVRWADAAKHYGRAAELDPNLATLRRAADFAGRAGDYPTALRSGEQALKEARTLGDDLLLASTLNGHALTLEATGRFDEAEPLYREAMTIREASLGKDHPDYASSLNNLATLYADMERFDEAIPLAEQALTIWEAKLGPEHPDSVGARASLAAMRAEREG